MARRLLLTYLTLTALTLVVVLVPLGRVFADREHDRLTFDIERDAQTIAALVEDDLETGVPPDVDEVFTGYRQSDGRVVVVDRAGISVADSEVAAPPPRDFSTRPEIAAALDGDRTSGTRRSDTLGTDLVYVAIPVTSGGLVHGAVRITYPTSTLDARVRATWLRLGALSVVVLAIVAAVGMVFARGVVRPAHHLQEAAGRLAAGDLTVRVDADEGPPELRALAVTFNAMAAQLGQLLEAQQRFVADASHQLRTPLAALRLRLETLTPFVDAAAVPKLEAAVAETSRLARLVHSLLVLARGDAAAAVAEPVELSALVAERTDAWEPVAADQGVELAGACPPGMWVDAVPGAVEQIIDNLVSNALDVAPAGSAIAIRVDTGPGAVHLHVVDEGPGMPAEERQQAFERFWRPGAGSGGSGDGFGLGLAIVAQLARNSGGEARLDPGPGGVGLDASVCLRRVTGPVPAEPSEAGAAGREP